MYQVNPLVFEFLNFSPRIKAAAVTFGMASLVQNTLISPNLDIDLAISDAVFLFKVCPWGGRQSSRVVKLLFWLGVRMTQAIDSKGRDLRGNLLLTITVNAVILERLGEIIKLEMEAIKVRDGSDSMEYRRWFGVSKLVEAVMKKANSWSLEEALLGLKLDRFAVVYCHHRILKLEHSAKKREIRYWNNYL